MVKRCVGPLVGQSSTLDGIWASRVLHRCQHKQPQELSTEPTNSTASPSRAAALGRRLSTSTPKWDKPLTSELIILARILGCTA